MIKPLGEMLLIKELITEDKTTKSGLIISHVIEHGLKQGEVLAKGDGDHNFEGKVIPIDYVEIGDIIYYSENNATEVEDDGDKYQFVNSKHIYGKKS